MAALLQRPRSIASAQRPCGKLAPHVESQDDAGDARSYIRTSPITRSLSQPAIWNWIAAHGALVSDTARQRLASVLARIAKSIGRPVPGGVELQVTNEELASAANITLFTASRILNEWQAARALTKHRGRIILHSPRRLFRLTG